MNKAVLIHGYGVGLTAPPFCKAYGATCGFEAFEQDITRQIAVPFRWAVEEHLPFPSSLNLLKQIRLYQHEKKLTRNTNIHYQLDQLLHQENPQIVVCHSLGSVLFLNYAQRYQFPESVTQLVLVQADISHKTTQFSAQIQSQLKNDTLKITNYYCPYDQALLVTPFLGGYLPAGLVGLRYPNIQNKLFPLHGRLNLHTASICNPRFRDEIMPQ